MKYIASISFILLSSYILSQTYTFEWKSKTKFNNIVYPGKKYIIKQLCQPKADSIASNGKITFWSASIDGVKELTLSYLIKDTILLSTELTTHGKENCKMLNVKISDLTDSKPAFISYGINKTIYKIFLIKREDIEYILYYEHLINFKKAHILIVPKK